jgi:hypothetical protein
MKFLKFVVTLTSLNLLFSVTADAQRSTWPPIERPGLYCVFSIFDFDSEGEYLASPTVYLSRTGLDDLPQVTLENGSTKMVVVKKDLPYGSTATVSVPLMRVKSLPPEYQINLEIKYKGVTYKADGNGEVNFSITEDGKKTIHDGLLLHAYCNLLW